MKRHVFSLEFLSALCAVAQGADQLVSLVLDGKPYADVMRTLILDLNNLDNESCGNVGEIGADLTQLSFGRVEMRDGNIWLFEEEEVPCPVKT